MTKVNKVVEVMVVVTSMLVPLRFSATGVEVVDEAA